MREIVVYSDQVWPGHLGWLLEEIQEEARSRGYYYCYGNGVIYDLHDGVYEVFHEERRWREPYRGVWRGYPPDHGYVGLEPGHMEKLAFTG